MATGHKRVVDYVAQLREKNRPKRERRNSVLGEFCQENDVDYWYPKAADAAEILSQVHPSLNRQECIDVCKAIARAEINESRESALIILGNIMGFVDTDDMENAPPVVEKQRNPKGVSTRRSAVRAKADYDDDEEPPF